MTNSEIVRKFDEIIRDAYDKCQAAGFIGPSYYYEKAECEKDYIEITGYDYRCGGDYDSFRVPYADLDDIDAFIVRRKAEEEEAWRRTAERKAAEDAEKLAAAEQAERQQYLKLKEKYEGAAK
jgi:hypothetical protein